MPQQHDLGRLSQPVAHASSKYSKLVVLAQFQCVYKGTALSINWNTKALTHLSATIFSFPAHVLRLFEVPVVGGFVPAATPEAFGPRNDGQFWALVFVAESVGMERQRTEMLRRFMLNRPPASLQVSLLMGIITAVNPSLAHRR